MTGPCYIPPMQQSRLLPVSVINMLMTQNPFFMRLLIVSNLVLLCFAGFVLFSSFDKPVGR